MSPHHPSRAGGFSLLELLVSIAVFAMMMAIVGQVVTEARNTWSKSASRVSQFRDARLAFELITRNISQATLNTYLDYEYSTGGAPQRYVRKSELHFATGGGGTGSTNPILSGQPKEIRPSHAIFFQAYLGHTLDPDMENLGSLLNGRGYYIQYTDGTELAPAFLGASAPKRWRYRLWEWMPASENDPSQDGNEIYTVPLGNSWFDNDQKLGWLSTGGNDGKSRLVAENVIAIFISPRTSVPDPENPASYANSVAIAPNYSYDSRSHGAGAFSANNSLQHLLPPLVQITLVAIDEIAASRLEDSSTPQVPPDFLAAPGVGSFVNAVDYESDLQSLEDSLIDQNINYRVFSTTVALRSAKWDASSLTP